VKAKEASTALFHLIFSPNRFHVLADVVDMLEAKGRANLDILLFALLLFEMSRLDQMLVKEKE
jgi:hypothetical protein